MKKNRKENRKEYRKEIGNKWIGFEYSIVKEKETGLSIVIGMWTMWTLLVCYSGKVGMGVQFLTRKGRY